MATPGAIGPFPPHVGADDEARTDYDRLRRRVMWSMPYGLYVVGSAAGGRRNLMTLNWATQVAFDPKLVGVGVERDALTHELITAGRAFTLCTVARDDRTIIRKFTKPVEVDEAASTMNGFAYRDGLTGSPILARAPGWMECEVRQEVATGGHTFFIGEVVDAGFHGPEDVELLRMEDTRMSYGG